MRQPDKQLSDKEVPRPVLVVAIALGVFLAIGVATVGLLVPGAQESQREAAEAAQRERRSGPLALPPLPAPRAPTPECAKVLAALPQELLIGTDRVPRRPLAQPAPAATVAWGDAAHDPITVRCGINAPAELTPTSRLTDVSGVSWLQLSEAGRSSWLVVDRPVYIVLTVPPNAGTGPVQDLSAIVNGTLPKRPVFR